MIDILSTIFLIFLAITGCAPNGPNDPLSGPDVQLGGYVLDIHGVWYEIGIVEFADVLILTSDSVWTRRIKSSQGEWFYIGIYVLTDKTIQFIVKNNKTPSTSGHVTPVVPNTRFTEEYILKGNTLIVGTITYKRGASKPISKVRI
jgi:hypothetical protein